MSDLPRETTDLTPSFGTFGDALEARLVALPHLGEAARPTIRRALQKLQDELLLSEPGLRSATEAQLRDLQIAAGIRNELLVWYASEKVVEAKGEAAPTPIEVRLAAAIERLAGKEPPTFEQIVDQFNTEVAVGRKARPDTLTLLEGFAPRVPVEGNGSIEFRKASALQLQPRYTDLIFMNATVMTIQQLRKELEEDQQVGPYSGHILVDGVDPSNDLYWGIGGPITEQRLLLLAWAREQDGFSIDEYDAHRDLQAAELTGRWARFATSYGAAVRLDRELPTKLRKKLFKKPEAAITIDPDIAALAPQVLNWQIQVAKRTAVVILGPDIATVFRPGLLTVEVDIPAFTLTLQAVDKELRTVSARQSNSGAAYLTWRGLAVLNDSMWNSRAGVASLLSRIDMTRAREGTWREPNTGMNFQDAHAFVEFLRARIARLTH